MQEFKPQRMLPTQRSASWTASVNLAPPPFLRGDRDWSPTTKLAFQPNSPSPSETKSFNRFNTKRSELSNLLTTIKANLAEAKTRVTQSYDGRRAQLAAEEQQINATAQAKITAINTRYSAQIASRQSDFERPKRNLQRDTANSKHECRCSPTQIQRYRSRISGPLLDRIDIHIEAPALSLTELRSEKLGETSAAISERVEASRVRPHARFAGSRTSANARMLQAQIRKHCAIDSTLGDLLQHAMEQLSLSARAYDRILKVARTIADLASADRIEAPHLLEAIQYRSLDRAVFSAKARSLLG